MDSAINSSHRRSRVPILGFAELEQRIGAALDCGCVVPVLVLRLPEFAQIAWREGRRNARAIERRTVVAFQKATRRIVRDGDVLAHERGSDRFAVAMLEPARGGLPPGSREIRSALERIAAAMSLSTGRQMETGWWTIEARDEIATFPETLAAALERGNRAREHHAMLATVGHELRTPLTSIRGYIETLLDGEVDSSTARRFLQTARREALRLGRLVDGMLEFSMLDLSASASETGCDVVEHVRATVDALVPLARQYAMTIRTRLPRKAIARLDGDACMHVLLNVVENAVKYGRRGGVVEIGCVHEERLVRIAVDDDGPGIPPDVRESIFALGVRGARNARGAGIGLAVVKAIVERSGGSVRALPSSLGGARFELRLPALPEEGNGHTPTAS